MLVLLGGLSLWGYNHRVGIDISDGGGIGVGIVVWLDLARV